MARPGQLAHVDIDGLFTALRPRILALGSGSSAGAGKPGPQGPAGPKGVNWRGVWAADTDYQLGDLVTKATAGGSVITYYSLVDHTSVAGSPPVPGGTANWHELGVGYLILDGSRPMTGALDMDHHSIANADDLEVEGTATVREDVVMTGAAGLARLTNARVIHMAGADAVGGEARVDGLERVVFNDQPSASVVQNPSTIAWHKLVEPGVDTAFAEGQESLSKVEHTLQLDVDAADVRVGLGWVVTRACAQSLDTITRGQIVWTMSAPDDFQQFAKAQAFDTGDFGGLVAQLPSFGVALNDVAPTEGNPPLWIMQRGYLRLAVDGGWSAGDILWASGTAGALASTVPTYTDAPIIRVGRVLVAGGGFADIDVDVQVVPLHNLMPGRLVPDAHPQYTGRRWLYAMGD